MSRRERRQAGNEASAATSPPRYALVVESTPDGYVVGRLLVPGNASIEWLSPTHVRPWTETRPKDITLSAEKWAEPDGTVTLKPKRVAKGTPVQVQVGWEVVFGESHDLAAKRSRDELSAITKAVWRTKRLHWRHLCDERKRNGPSGGPLLPERVAVPLGEVCPHCGQADKAKATAA